MNVDYDLDEGQTATVSVRHTFCRGTPVDDRGEIVTQPGHGRLWPLAVTGRRGGSMTRCSWTANAVIATSTSSARQSGGRFAGANRLAWTPGMAGCPPWLRGKLGAIDSADTDPRATCGATIQGESDEYLIVGSHIDAVPDGGGSMAASACCTALSDPQLQRRGGSLPIGVRFVDWAERRAPDSAAAWSALGGRRDPGGRRRAQ